MLLPPPVTLLPVVMLDIVGTLYEMQGIEKVSYSYLLLSAAERVDHLFDKMEKYLRRNL